MHTHAQHKPDALADDLRGVHNVFKDSLLHRCECPRAGAGTLLDGLAVHRLGQNGALGDDDDVSAREFLFQFAHDALLNLVKVLELLERDKDENSLSLAGQLHFLCGGDLEELEVRLDVR